MGIDSPIERPKQPLDEQSTLRHVDFRHAHDIAIGCPLLYVIDNNLLTISRSGMPLNLLDRSDLKDGNGVPTTEIVFSFPSGFPPLLVATSPATRTEK